MVNTSTEAAGVVPSSAAGVATPPDSDAATPAASGWKALRGSGRTGNRVFQGVSTAAGIVILLVLAAVAAFLLAEAWPALSDPSLRVRAMGSAARVSLTSLTAPQVFGTVLGSLLALIMAVPLALGIALFITQYAPSKLAATLGYIVDLLAAVPSVVFGLWGGLWLLPKLVPIYRFLNAHFGWFPLFAGKVSPTGRVLASAAVILAVMIVPIVTAITRDIFAQTPPLMKEAAIAMGATKWEMIRLAVLPHGKSGIVSASMLGLGRALGETMAVVMVLSVGSRYSWHILQAGNHSTIAANIALQFPEASGVEMSALIATGLALFVITMLVNMAARVVITRAQNFSGANA